MDFPSCAEVWRCLLCWCRDTGTVLAWRVLPELKQLVTSTAAKKDLKFFWSLAQSVPRTPSVYGGTLSPSPHPILSRTLYISPILSLVSCSITFYTSSSLPPLCFNLSLFLYYPKSPHKPRGGSRAQMSRRKHDTNLIGQHCPEKGQSVSWARPAFGPGRMRTCVEPKVGTFLKSLSPLCFSLCNADLCLQADTASVLC